MSSNITHSKLKKQSEGEVLLKIQWSGKEIFIVILDNNNAWTSNVHENQLEKLAKQHCTKLDEYFDNVKKYLTQSLDEISINIDNNNFILYKMCNSIRIKYFYCNVLEVNYVESVTEIINQLIIDSKSLKSKITDLENENQNLKKENKEYKEKLEAKIKNQEEEEKKLFGSFLKLLNEKKKRIQFLTETLESFKANRLEDMGMNYLQQSTKPKETQIHVETVSDTEYETDDDKISVHSNVSNNDNLIDEEQPSTSTNILPKRNKRSLQLDVIQNKNIEVDKEIVENKKKKGHEETVKKEEINPEDSPIYEPDYQDLLAQL